MSSLFDNEDQYLPSELQEAPEWKAIRNEVIVSLKKESEGLPMTTAQQMMLERLATFYVLLRKRETEPGSKLSFAEIRQNQDQWLKMATEFNKQLVVGEDKRRHAMLESIQKIIINAITLIDDERTRENVRKKLEQDFISAGL